MEQRKPISIVVHPASSSLAPLPKPRGRRRWARTCALVLLFLAPTAAIALFAELEPASRVVDHPCAQLVSAEGAKAEQTTAPLPSPSQARARARAGKGERLTRKTRTRASIAPTAAPSTPPDTLMQGPMETPPAALRVDADATGSALPSLPTSKMPYKTHGRLVLPAPPPGTVAIYRSPLLD